MFNLYKERINIKYYFNKLYKNTKEQFYEQVRENILNGNKMFIITANPETIMTAEKNENLKEALLDKNTTIIPDGIGIVKGAQMFNYKVAETIPGVELCSKLFEYSNKYKKSIFLFGAKQEVLFKLSEKIKQDYPNANICGIENGYVKDKQKVMEKISLLNPDIILVALGIPYQEMLIYNNLNKFDKGIFVGVGGSFDVLSGTKKRAPKFFRKLNIEWLYRIMREPKRLKRFLNNNIRYILKIKKEVKDENFNNNSSI